jgi:LPXTG-motif cell wall-anchored protein
MSEKLSIIASVSVIVLVIYAGYLLKDVSKSDVKSLVNTINSVSKTFGTPQPELPDNNRVYLIGGIILLAGATLFTLVKRK